MSLAALVLAACGRSTTFSGVEQQLAGQGFSQVSVEAGPVEGIGDVVAVQAVAPAGLADDEGYDAVARVVWTALPVRVDGLQVELNGETATIDRDGLERLLGPRNPALDEHTIAEDSAAAGIAIVVVGAVLLLLAVGTVVVVVRVRRRRRADELLRGQFGAPPAPGPFPPGPYPPGSYPPGPYQPGPYPPGRYPPGPPPGYLPPQPGYQQPPAGL